VLQELLSVAAPSLVLLGRTMLLCSETLLGLYESSKQHRIKSGSKAAAGSRDTPGASDVLPVSHAEVLEWLTLFSACVEGVRKCIEGVYHVGSCGDTSIGSANLAA
jgi:hypothetical protein